MGITVGDSDLDNMHIGTGLNRPVGISGRLVDYTGAPLRNETVTLYGNRQGRITTATDQDGKFSLAPVPPNQRYSLRIAAAGLNPTAMELNVEERNVELGIVIVQPLRPMPLTSVPAAIRTSNVPGRNARISARITDATGVPYSEKAVYFRDLRMVKPFQPENIALSTLVTDHNGMFVLPALSGDEYEVYVPESSNPVTFKGMANIEATGGWDVDLGNVAMQVSPPQKPVGELVGPVKVTQFPSIARSTGTPVQIVAVFAGAGGVMNVVHSDSKVVQQPKEKEQVGCSSLLISDDHQAVGWLVDSDFCCTSYPIQLMLVVYMPGKPLQRFTGDGRAIFDWKFVAGERQVAFYQDFLHGTQAQHYELRDIETGRLVQKWDGDLTPKAPKWTSGMPK